ncbi:60S acidic ribosomal protein P2 isoform X2 [Harpia harpyja]|uniref:60S acidic ribosomal protein P2 isoform X2 n=1 Tax=Harpia harpyja TaxID=202280 RepID=UPI0022B13D75|nr:60S acidic ribosomal protein P2 isoform X2 [Harpia harpyja]
MRYVAAYLLAVLGGNESPTSKDLKKILDSVGIETDDERMNKVMENWPACRLGELWPSLLEGALPLLLQLLPLLPLRRRKKRRRRSLKNLTMTWDLAYLINYLL